MAQVAPAYDHDVKPAGSHHLPQWSSGLCDCTDRCGLLIFSWFCFPCAAGHAHAQIDKFNGKPDDCGVGHCIVPCLLTMFLGNLGMGIESCLLTSKISQVTGLQAGCFGSFLKGCCCPCCAVTQQRKHLDAAHMPAPGGFCGTC